MEKANTNLILSVFVVIVLLWVGVFLYQSLNQSLTITGLATGTGASSLGAAALVILGFLIAMFILIYNLFYKK